jgi:penicillin V acylase-like amidase (Ntn superfamily)
MNRPRSVVNRGRRLFETGILAAALLVSAPAAACTRCLHTFGDGTVVVGRSMDWLEDPGSEIWCFPRGMQRHGNAGPHRLTWTSRYGSVGVSFYGVAIACGMNEEGLVTNLLYLAESNSGKPASGRPTLSIGGWAHYALDSHAIFECLGGAGHHHAGRAQRRQHDLANGA